MNAALWSLHNKLEDMQVAIQRADAAWLRMAAFEFAIRLDHTIREWSALLEHSTPYLETKALQAQMEQMTSQLETIRQGNETFLQESRSSDREILAREADELSKSIRTAQEIWARLAQAGRDTSDIP